jgi:hypothetical protein
MGGSLYGRFPSHVKGVAFTNWLSSTLDQSVEHKEFPAGLVAELDGVVDASWSDGVGLHIAGWFEWDDFPNMKIPSMLRVARPGPHTSYKATRLPPDDIMYGFRDRYQADSGDYALFIYTDGIAPLGSHLDRLDHVFRDLLGAPLELKSAGAVAEYVRRLIQTVAWLYQFTKQGQVVNEPINLLIIPRDPLRSISIRF